MCSAAGASAIPAAAFLQNKIKTNGYFVVPVWSLAGVAPPLLQTTPPVTLAPDPDLPLRSAPVILPDKKAAVEAGLREVTD